MQEKDVKSILREHLRQRRNILPWFERNRRAMHVVPLVCGLDLYKAADVIIGYIPITGELSPMSILKQAREDGKKVYIPLPDTYPMGMRPMYNEKYMHYYVSKTGSSIRVYVPRYYGKDVSIQKMLYSHRCVVIVPGLGFSREGERIGRGGGFYDRLLAMKQSITGAVTSIGICFEEQLCEDIPMQEHDIRMHYVIAV